MVAEERPPWSLRDYDVTNLCIFIDKLRMRILSAKEKATYNTISETQGLLGGPDPAVPFLFQDHPASRTSVISILNTIFFPNTAFFLFNGKKENFQGTTSSDQYLK